MALAFPVDAADAYNWKYPNLWAFFHENRRVFVFCTFIVIYYWMNVKIYRNAHECTMWHKVWGMPHEVSWRCSTAVAYYVQRTLSRTIFLHTIIYLQFSHIFAFLISPTTFPCNFLCVNIKNMKKVIIEKMPHM